MLPPKTHEAVRVDLSCPECSVLGVRLQITLERLINVSDRITASMGTGDHQSLDEALWAESRTVLAQCEQVRADIKRHHADHHSHE